MKNEKEEKKIKIILLVDLRLTMSSRVELNLSV